MSETAGKIILVIDDEPDVLTYLTTLLENNGFTTITATNGKEGLKKAIRDKPDLITLDISMPEKSGVKFYREIKNNPELSNIPIIIVTAVVGYGRSPDDFEKFISTRKNVPPPDGFIPKPIDKEDFLKQIREFLKIS